MRLVVVVFAHAGAFCYNRIIMLFVDWCGNGINDLECLHAVHNLKLCSIFVAVQYIMYSSHRASRLVNHSMVAASYYLRTTINNIRSLSQYGGFAAVTATCKQLLSQRLAVSGNESAAREQGGAICSKCCGMLLTER